jgi:hypothetical protein
MVALSDFIERFDVPGVAVTIVHGGRRGVSVAGVASTRSQAPMTVHDRLPISCVMKVMVALMLHHGAEQGLLDLDEDVVAYLPELGAPSGVTLRRLLTHTAGYVEPQENSARWSYDWARFVDFFPQRKQAFAPGSVWSYTHTGYVLLAKVLETVFGQTTEALLKERLLEPLGLYGGLYSGGDDEYMDLHVRSTRTHRLEPMRPPAETGFLRYSISDVALSTDQLGTFAAALAGLYNDRIPHLEKARQALLAPAIALPAFCPSPQGELMPLAYRQGVADYGGVLGVNGSYVGSTCALRFSPDAGFGLAVSINTWAPFARDFTMIQAAQPFVRLSPPPRPGPAGDFADWEGDYEGLMLGAETVSIVRRGDGWGCSVKRKGASTLEGQLEAGPDGRPIIVAEQGGLTLALARTDDQTPYLMSGASAFRKLAA